MATRKMPAAVKAKLGTKRKRTSSSRKAPAHLKKYQFGPGGKKASAAEQKAKRRRVSKTPARKAKVKALKKVYGRPASASRTRKR